MELSALKSKSSVISYKDGDIITTEGEQTANEMYILLSGNVGVYKNYQSNNRVKLTDLGPGSFFGEMSLFLNKARSATVVAQGVVMLMAVTRDNAYEFFEKETKMTYNLIRTLCQRLDDTNRQLTALKTKGRAPASAKTAATPPAKPSAPPVGVPAGLADLFPAGHKAYTHTPPPAKGMTIYTKSFECPLCGQNFNANSVRTSKLKVITRDKDFRVRYGDIDTTYHEVITCTHCCFTTFEANIKDKIPARNDVNKPQIAKYKNEIKFAGNAERDITGVFAGYYLALKCFPLFYAKAEVVTAKAWMRLMWLYEDCGDTEMAQMALEKAHECYITVFKETEMSQDASQQTCVIIGELSLRLDDFDNAKTFFLNARMNRSGSAALIKQAEDGIEEVKKREQAKGV